MDSRIYLSPPDMTGVEREALIAAFDSNWIAPVGPEIDAFERELADKLAVAEAAALSSGTAALHLALVLCEIGRGDEVWTSTLTFAATANAVRYVGATPVFIDSEPTSWNLDPDLLANALKRGAQAGRLPKAVIAVDLYGQCANYEAIEPLCEEYGVTLIEDAAEALGASRDRRAAGTFGRIGVLSFNGNKIITTSGGGALVSRNSSWVCRARHLASQAREPVAHYEHREVGYNYRLSNLLAALGRVQLSRLDELVDRRRAVNATYRAALSIVDGLDFMPEAPGCRSTNWLTCILLDPDRAGVGRDEVRAHLEKHNIEARPVWKPMHLQPVHASCRVIGGAIAQSLFERGLCLPSGSSLRSDDLDRVIETFLSTPGLHASRPVA